MRNDTALQELVYKPAKWSTQEVVSALKQVNGKFQIDSRKWINQGNPQPTSKGIQLDLEDWPGVIKNIQELLDSYYNQNGKG